MEQNAVDLEHTRQRRFYYPRQVVNKVASTLKKFAISIISMLSFLFGICLIFEHWILKFVKRFKTTELAEEREPLFRTDVDDSLRISSAEEGSRNSRDLENLPSHIASEFPTAIFPSQDSRGEMERIISQTQPELVDESDTHPDFPNESGTDLELRYTAALSRNDLEEMVRIRETQLHLCATSHRADALSNLANTLSRRFDYTGAQVDLDKAIQLLSEALFLRPLGHSDRVVSLHTLANALHERFHRTGAHRDHEESIPLFKEVLKLLPFGHPDRYNSLRSLCCALSTRYRHTSALDDLEEWVQLSTEALDICRPGHPDRGPCLNELASALGSRYDRIGMPHDLDERIRMLTEALDLHESKHPDYGMFLQNLANALNSRYNHTGAEDDLEKSVQLFREALLHRPRGHPNHVLCLNNLSNALGSRYNRTGAQNDLEERIQLLSDALTLCPPSHRHHSMTLNNLAIALGNRYNLTGQRDDLENRIRLLVDALKLRPPGHINRGGSLVNLANALGSRYDCTGTQHDLEERIELLREALQCCPIGHQFHVNALISLANALGSRYDRTGVQHDLEERIQLLRKALDCCPPGHPSRGLCLNNLANALNTGKQHDLEERIRLLRETLDLRPVGHPDRGASLNNLASALGSRYESTSSQHDLEERIQFLRGALKLCPSGHQFHVNIMSNLGDALHSQYDSIGGYNHLEESIRLFSDVRKLCPSGHPQHASISIQLSRALWHTRDSSLNTDMIFGILKEGSMDLISPLNDSLECARLWVDWARQINHDSLGDAYHYFIQFLGRYLTIGPTIKLQYGALIRQPWMLSLPMDAAAYAIESDNVEKAVEWLDEGRSLLLSQMRRFREPLLQLAAVSEELATRFETTCSELRNVTTTEAKYSTVSTEGKIRNVMAPSPPSAISFDVLLSRKRKLLEDYETLLGLIRKRPGLEDFLCSPPFEKLQEAAKEGPIVIINCSRFGSHVIIVYHNRRPSVIALGGNFYKKAFEVHEFYLVALSDTKVAINPSKALGEKLKDIMQQLWTLVVSEVVDELERAGTPKESRIWWCPTSVLTALPLHAAGSGEGYFMDSYISSYTPTLKALIDARYSPPRSTSKLSGPHPKLLVVAQTDSNLKRAKQELDVMCNLGPFVDFLDGPDATRDSVLKSLPSHDWSHFICHGTLAELDPFDSSLHLHRGDKLSVNDIIKAHLPDAKFAFLAACHTAEQGRSESVLQDEILHLAGAVLFSGFRSVIGTMWEMEDKDGPVIARHFYQEMLKGNDNTGQRHIQAAQALWKVTRIMKQKRFSPGRWVNFVHIGA